MTRRAMLRAALTYVQAGWPIVPGATPYGSSRRRTTVQCAARPVPVAASCTDHCGAAGWIVTSQRPRHRAAVVPSAGALLPPGTAARTQRCARLNQQLVNKPIRPAIRCGESPDADPRLVSCSQVSGKLVSCGVRKIGHIRGQRQRGRNASAHFPGSFGSAGGVGVGVGGQWQVNSPHREQGNGPVATGSAPSVCVGSLLHGAAGTSRHYQGHGPGGRQLCT